MYTFEIIEYKLFKYIFDKTLKKNLALEKNICAFTKLALCPKIVILKSQPWQ